MVPRFGPKVSPFVEGPCDSYPCASTVTQYCCSIRCRCRRSSPSTAWPSSAPALTTFGHQPTALPTAPPFPLQSSVRFGGGRRICRRRRRRRSPGGRQEGDAADGEVGRRRRRRSTTDPALEEEDPPRQVEFRFLLVFDAVPRSPPLHRLHLKRPHSAVPVDSDVPSPTPAETSRSSGRQTTHDCSVVGCLRELPAVVDVVLRGYGVVSECAPGQ